MSTRLLDALRGQRAELKRLLIKAEVPVADAERLLLNALGEKSDEEWESVGDVDAELLACVGQALEKYAASRVGDAEPAPEGRPRPGPEGRRGRSRR